MKKTKDSEELFTHGNKAELLQGRFIETKNIITAQKGTINRVKSARACAKRAAAYCEYRAEFSIFAK